MQLVDEISQICERHKDKAIVTFRLNGTSDLPYEKYKVKDGKNIFELFPDVIFYDYTKNWTRFDKQLPSNYHLTFSRSESNHNKSMELLRGGVNVAMVFTKTPTSYEGFEVIDGDKDDLRFLDKKGGVIVGLRYKMMTGLGGGEKNKEAITSGFVINTTPIQDTIRKLDKVYSKARKTELV